MMSLYKDNGISMTGGMGCLPTLIQFPIFAALYAAIQYSPALASGARVVCSWESVLANQI